MVSRETPGPAPDLPAWLDERRPALVAFADLLADVGVTRGLIGPREVPRLWERHLLNCAVVADPDVGLLAPGTRVADVGSGAGLPGLVWAIVRPDIDVVLIEPLLRRSTFLSEAITALGLERNTHVLRGRAEDVTREAAWRPVDVATARAVAPLDRLIGWTIPLLRPGGHLLALKGSSAEEELERARPIARAAGLVDLRVVVVGIGVVEPPTRVITGVRGAAQ
ncbi:MAG: 16S rRNA (guanine(527)-N(7))-methyltransferase RsmG [Actinobacteria bacterium]|jgi:16S rRNA (guanine527-N7)-methyltransferase|nr:16S rRNA (guanine(527)-N(7))-methyltransferase RsmG [Actinomycetota bacterium]